MKQSDEQLAEAVNKYMASHKNATRGEIRKHCKTSIDRLTKLQNDGMIKLNPKLSLSQAATLGRKKHNTAGDWFIKSKAPWQRNNYD